MPKKIHIKQYDYNDNFTSTLIPKKFWSDISFTETINYGFGTFNFRYHVDFEDEWFIHWDIIRVYKDGTDLIYKGFIIGIKRVIEPGGAYQDITCVGMQAALNYRLYTSASSVTFTKTDDAADIITDILDVYNADPVLTAFVYSVTTIPAYWTTISVDFDKDTCRSALKKVLDTVNRNIMFLGDNDVYFKDTYSSHRLNFASDISQITVDEKSDQVFSDITVKRSWWTETAVWTPFYGRREKYITDTSLKTSGTGQERANKELANSESQKFNTSIIVNSNYDIESIHCGDTISIYNTWYPITDKKVVKIEYNVETAKIYVDDYDSIEKALSGNI